MAIVDKIHDLTKKMTGQDGVGSDITTAINDLTAKWTQSAGKGSNIEESIANLSSNASSGGGGDLTTAEVTVIDGTTGQGVISHRIDNCPVVVNDEEYGSVITVGVEVPKASQITVTVPLLKEGCEWITFSWLYNYTVSGNIEDNDGVLRITGDGTVTLTGLA